MRPGLRALIATVSLLFAPSRSDAGPPIAAAQDQTPTDFYVSPRGNDRWSGKLADPGKDDGPFATPARAREAVRAILKTQTKPVRVVLRAGTYYLDSPLEFGPEDSGTRVAPVVYAAGAGEKVILSGGHRLDGGRWGEVNARRAWVVHIPEIKARNWRFRQLFVGGERRPRTRLPKRGEFRIESLPGYTGDFLRSPTKRFIYAPGDIVPDWRNLRDVEVVAITKWLDNRLPIESVDEKSRTASFDRPSLFALLSGDKPGTYWVENVVEALDTPGQWYLDRPTGTLYILPRTDEDMASAEIIAPRLPQVVRVVGREDAPVHDLRFEGLTFAHTEWRPPADYSSSLQAGIEVPGAVLFDYAERCVVTGGGIEHIGNYGVEVGVGCSDIEITRNRITDIGADQGVNRVVEAVGCPSCQGFERPGDRDRPVVLGDPLYPLGDPGRKIANPLQVAVDSQDGEDSPKVGGDRFIKCQDPQALALDGDLSAVDVLLVLLDLGGEFGSSITQRPDTQVERRFDDGGHPQRFRPEVFLDPQGMSVDDPRSRTRVGLSLVQRWHGNFLQRIGSAIFRL